MVLTRNPETGKMEASLSASGWLAIGTMLVAVAGSYAVMQATISRITTQLDRIEQRQLELSQRISRIEGKVGG